MASILSINGIPVSGTMSTNDTVAQNYVNYEVREVHTPYGGRDITLEVKGVQSLPAALKRLAEMGHDMSASLEVLQKAVAAQAKRKALDEAVAGLAKE